MNKYLGYSVCYSKLGIKKNILTLLKYNELTKMNNDDSRQRYIADMFNFHKY